MTGNIYLTRVLTLANVPSDIIKGEEFGTYNAAHHLCEPDVFGFALMLSISYTFTGVDLYFARASSLN